MTSFAEVLRPLRERLPLPQPAWLALRPYSISISWGGSQVPPTQLSLAQSLLTLQSWPISQPGQLAPPQSTSVSSPFCTPSEQLGA